VKQSGRNGCGIEANFRGYNFGNRNWVKNIGFARFTTLVFMGINSNVKGFADEFFCPQR
jgi:hypothetical protein